jgi:alpha-D-ribose 1-methylphosphonate 5-triphosphate synthase subunit PhnG
MMNNIEQKRKSALSVLSKSSLDSIVEQWSALGINPAFNFLKTPEVGMVMVRGQAGGDGQTFNVGEMTVTRCVVQLHSKEIGYGYTAGRNIDKSKIIALIDACFQVSIFEKNIEDRIINPLRVSIEEKQEHQKNKIETSTVDFFTMIRGE